MQRPLLSIAMPVRNAAPYLPLSLGSILAQSFRDWELLLFDDGSVDQSFSILQRLSGPRVRIFHDGRNLGGAARRNQLIREAQGEYLAYIDADDLMHPSRLEMQLSFLNRHPHIDGVGCGILVLDEELRPSGIHRFPTKHDQICARPLRGISIGHATFLARTDWWKRHPYNDRNRCCEDWELWFSAYENSHFANLTEPLYFYRPYSSFSVQREVHSRLTIARLQWKRRARFGTIAAASAWAAEYARSGVIAGLWALGLRDWLIRRRSRPVDTDAIALYYSAIPTIVQHAITLFGPESVPSSLLDDCKARETMVHPVAGASNSRP